MTDNNKFDKWVDMWDKAQKDGTIESPTTKPEAGVEKEDFFGQSNTPAPKLLQEGDVEYWNKLSGCKYQVGVDPACEENLNEDDRITPAPQPIEPDLGKKEIGDVASTVANAANPIQPASVGKDQNYKPNLADVNQLEQLHDMKVNLHELESKLNNKDALAKSDQGKKIQTQIENMKAQIDALSDSISPDFLKSYLT